MEGAAGARQSGGLAAQRLAYPYTQVGELAGGPSQKLLLGIFGPSNHVAGEQGRLLAEGSRLSFAHGQGAAVHIEGLSLESVDQCFHAILGHADGELCSPRDHQTLFGAVLWPLPSILRPCHVDGVDADSGSLAEPR